MSRVQRHGSGPRSRITSISLLAAGLASAVTITTGVKAWSLPRLRGEKLRAGESATSLATAPRRWHALPSSLAKHDGTERGGPSKFCCGSVVLLRWLSVAFGCQSLARGAVALSAERRRRRRKEEETALTKTEQLQEQGLLPLALARKYKVTAEELEFRRDERRKNKQCFGRGMDVDVIKKLTIGPEPEIWGIPYIWVQIGHATLGITLPLSAWASNSPWGASLNFALADLEGDLLTCLIQLLFWCLCINIVNAAILTYEVYSSDYWEELGADEQRNAAAFGFGVKALLLGGVASWQRYGRIGKIEKKKRDDQVDEVIEALREVPDGSKVMERITIEGRQLGAGRSQKERLLNR